MVRNPFPRTNCVGCNRNVPISNATQTEEGVLCSICQAENRVDPVAEIEALNRDLARLGEKPDAPLVKETVAVWKAESQSNVGASNE